MLSHHTGTGTISYSKHNCLGDRCVAMSVATLDSQAILDLLQKNAPLLTAVAVLAATYLFVKRIQQTGQCPFAGRPAAAPTQPKVSPAHATHTHTPHAPHTPMNQPTNQPTLNLYIGPRSHPTQAFRPHSLLPLFPASSKHTVCSIVVTSVLSREAQYSYDTDTYGCSVPVLH
jgi:hypothetical protein